MADSKADGRTQIGLAIIGAISTIAVAIIGARQFITPTTDDPSRDDRVPDPALSVGKDTATISVPTQTREVIADVVADTTARISIPGSMELYLVVDGNEYADCPRVHQYRNPQDTELLWSLHTACSVPLRAGRAHSITAQQINANADALTTKIVAHYSWKK